MPSQPTTGLQTSELIAASLATQAAYLQGVARIGFPIPMMTTAVQRLAVGGRRFTRAQLVSALLDQPPLNRIQKHLDYRQNRMGTG
jgi:hypothetical protein